MNSLSPSSPRSIYLRVPFLIIIRIETFCFKQSAKKPPHIGNSGITSSEKKKIILISSRHDPRLTELAEGTINFREFYMSYLVNVVYNNLWDVSTSFYGFKSQWTYSILNLSHSNRSQRVQRQLLFKVFSSLLLLRISLSASSVVPVHQNKLANCSRHNFAAETSM